MRNITRRLSNSFIHCVALTGIATCASAAGAATIVSYNSLNAFNAAVGVTQLETFESSSGSTTITTPTVTLTSTDSRVFVNTSNVFGSGRFIGANGGSSTTTSVSLAFAPPVYALGFRYTSGSLGSLVLTGAGTVTGVPISGFPNLGFFGVLSDTPFSSAVFRIQNDGLEFDNVMTQAAGAVPEPTTWTLMVTGFGIIGFAVRRRPRLKATVTYA